ncbi:uncharacterized protein A4U43_C06F6340 [Asparagus officinalis]|uniref:Chromatin modification-related protein MEAF6 n=1 Tax=Asparagus officinalis TaxID=4686 RepID=A0A5P1EMA1_ASPOF|nr:chromatin modification-related protein eaf6-like [Asparagus officinalis]ONK66307.1 uncharacterized protein A4U43_C06F6340 [Asparagus officinalis]
MDSEGQRTSSNPQATLTALVGKREKLKEELRMIERQVYDLETSYLQESSQYGSVLKGFEGFLSLSKSTNMKRSRKFQPEDRLFSLSSVTSPAVEEHAVGRDDGRSDYGSSRSKGGSFFANGQGKPKKGGRIPPREGRRIRPPSIQHDMDDDDDEDMDLGMR